MTRSAPRREHTISRQMVTDLDRAATKQIPTTIFFVAILVACAILPAELVRNATAIVVATVLLVIATVLALMFPVSRKWSQLAFVIPLIDFVAIGVLRVGAGSTTESFSALIILPHIWIAAEYGRRNAVLASVGAAVAVMIPFALDWELWGSPFLVIRAILAVGVFTVAALLINLLAR